MCWCTSIRPETAAAAGMAARASKSPAGRSEPAPAMAIHCSTCRREEASPDSRRAGFVRSRHVAVSVFCEMEIFIGAPFPPQRRSRYFQPTGNLHLAAPANNAKDVDSHSWLSHNPLAICGCEWQPATTPSSLFWWHRKNARTVKRFPRRNVHARRPK